VNLSWFQEKRQAISCSCISTNIGSQAPDLFAQLPLQAPLPGSESPPGVAQPGMTVGCLQGAIWGDTKKLVQDPGVVRPLRWGGVSGGSGGVQQEALLAGPVYPSGSVAEPRACPAFGDPQDILIPFKVRRGPEV
jgi:hypothetical protein